MSACSTHFLAIHEYPWLDCIHSMVWPLPFLKAMEDSLQRAVRNRSQIWSNTCETSHCQTMLYKWTCPKFERIPSASLWESCARLSTQLILIEFKMTNHFTQLSTKCFSMETLCQQRAPWTNMARVTLHCASARVCSPLSITSRFLLILLLNRMVLSIQPRASRRSSIWSQRPNSIMSYWISFMAIKQAGYKFSAR